MTEERHLSGRHFESYSKTVKAYDMRNNASQVYNSLPVRYNQGEGRRGDTRLTQPKNHNMMTRRPIRHGNSAVGREEEGSR